MDTLKNNRGVTIVALVVMMLILAVMGTSLISLVATENNTSIQYLKAIQAQYIAEGGLEYILAAPRVFPNYSTNGATVALGAGSFRTDTPAYLPGALNNSATSITVNSTIGFPASGRIVIDSEVIAYTGTTATTFTGATRGSDGTAAAAHASGNAIYPVTRLNGALNSSATSFNVTSTTGFMIAGVVKIDSEYIYCTGDGGTSFTGCTRGYQNTTAAAHANLADVFQYAVTSTGTVNSAFGNAQRVVKTSVGGTSGSTIGFDAASFTNGNTNSLTWSHTVSGTNRILVVGVSMKNGSSETVTGVTYAGTPFPNGNKITRNNSTNVQVELWWLPAPAIGANNVVVTLSGSVRVVGGAVSFTEVDQANPLDASNTASGTSAAPSVTVTTVADNAWVVSAVASSAPTSDATTNGAGHNRRWNDLTGGSGSGAHVRGAGSTFGPKSPPGNVPMSWSLGGSADWAIAAAAVKPVPNSVFMLDWREVFP